jgi:mono/diheme cytochrome c family protein
MFRRFSLAASIVGAVLAACAAGCGSPAAEFRRYATYAHKMEKDTGIEDYELSEAQLEEVDSLLAAMFGTPDEPAIPNLPTHEGSGGDVLLDADLSTLFDLPRLTMAAGPVGSDELGNPRGLYREHCAHCHGITGDGFGPTAAFLNPYPRDYRPGKFKFKSTPIGFKPTHDDLKKVVLEGIPGTAMPSFALLTDLEVESLVYYVKYLAIRGEVERALLYASAQLDEDARLVNKVAASDTAEQKAERDTQLVAIREQVAGVIERWVTPVDPDVIKIPQRPRLSGEALAESRRLGRDLFYGTVANCVKCHGDSALGDGELTQYDDWAKEFINDGKDRDVVHEYTSRGLPDPRIIRPRNLRLGVYRGGMRPIDLYWRIRNGIEGTPMPAATMKPGGDPAQKGLLPEDIWHIVNYVESLPYESISNPNTAATLALQREGN